MRDRLPTKTLDNGALRYGVYDEEGNFLRHEYLALDDEPTDDGTPLSKDALLKDSTEVSLFGSAADRTVDEAFAGLAAQIKLVMNDMASISVTLQANGVPISDVLVQGILSENGQAVYSNESGVASGYIAEGTQVISVSGYADIEDWSETIEVTKGTTITKSATLATRNFLKLTSSKSVKFSGNVETVDVTVVGGGSGGSTSTYEEQPYDWAYPATGGGSGGYCVISEAVTFIANKTYAAVVGAGGSPTYYKSPSTDGGSSSFLGIVAEGGKSSYISGADLQAAVGNGNGGLIRGKNSGTTATLNQPPTESTTYGFASFTEMMLYGGGGATFLILYGGEDDDTGTTHESATHTQNGGYYESGHMDGIDGTGGGGCGGTLNASRGKGGCGCVAMRMHLKSAS